MTIYKSVIRVWAGVSLGSLLFYAITGMPLWAPVGDDGLRVLLLTFAHAVPFIALSIEYA